MANGFGAFIRPGIGASAGAPSRPSAAPQLSGAAKTFYGASVLNFGFTLLANRNFGKAARIDAQATDALYRARRSAANREATSEAAYAAASARLREAKTGVRSGSHPRAARILAAAERLRMANAAAARFDALNLAANARQLSSRFRQQSIDHLAGGLMQAVSFANTGI